MQVDLPEVGVFERHKGGRVRFAFDAALLATFRACATPAATPGPASRAATPAAAASSRPVTASMPVAPVATSPAYLTADMGSANAHTFAALHALCVAADPVCAGTVRRLAMERWLGGEGRPLLGQLSAATVLDLLSAHACGVIPCAIQHSILVAVSNSKLAQP